MQVFLRSLLQELERRCGVLCKRLAEATDMDVQAHAMQAYQDVKTIQREIGGLLASPDLNVPALQSNHLSSFKRWHETIQLREFYSLSFAERFNDVDRSLTKLGQRLTVQVNWPLPAPLIASFSNQYYWTFVPFQLICVPAAENTTLLGWPDLCHELGHDLVAQFSQQLAGKFLMELDQYVQSEQQRAVALSLPGVYVNLI